MRELLSQMIAEAEERIRTAEAAHDRHRDWECSCPSDEQCLTCDNLRCEWLAAGVRRNTLVEVLDKLIEGC